MEVVDIKKILVPNLLIYIYLHCVRSSSWCATMLATLLCMTNGSKVLIYLTLLYFLLHYLQEYSKIFSPNNSDFLDLCLHWASVFPGRTLFSLVYHNKAFCVGNRLQGIFHVPCLLLFSLFLDTQYTQCVQSTQLWSYKLKKSK